jgi:hypothetical protein
MHLEEHRTRQAGACAAPRVFAIRHKVFNRGRTSIGVDRPDNPTLKVGQDPVIGISGGQKRALMFPVSCGHFDYQPIKVPPSSALPAIPRLDTEQETASPLASSATSKVASIVTISSSSRPANYGADKMTPSAHPVAAIHIQGLRENIPCFVICQEDRRTRHVLRIAHSTRRNCLSNQALLFADRSPFVFGKQAVDPVPHWRIDNARKPLDSGFFR